LYKDIYINVIVKTDKNVSFDFFPSFILF